MLNASLVPRAHSIEQSTHSFVRSARNGDVLLIRIMKHRTKEKACERSLPPLAATYRWGEGLPRDASEKNRTSKRRKEDEMEVASEVTSEASDDKYREKIVDEALDEDDDNSEVAASRRWHTLISLDTPSSWWYSSAQAALSKLGEVDTEGGWIVGQSWVLSGRNEVANRHWS